MPPTGCPCDPLGAPTIATHRGLPPSRRTTVGVRVTFRVFSGFMLGVLGLITTEYVFLAFPQYFWLWYAITQPGLIAIRWCLYRKAKYQYFLYDFCYFVQVLWDVIWDMPD